MKTRRDYQRDEQLVLGAYVATRGDVAADSEVEIARRARCKPGVAFRVAMLRRGGTAGLLDLWIDGLLTLRQTERIVLAFAFDEPGQMTEAAHSSREARQAILGR